ncbi:MAG: cytochrome C [Deltaproteobacteria bacterium]|nr:cytochrome C [Deltaproteobacteria bacterium]
MKALFKLLRRFWRGLSTNWIGTAGVVLTTTGFLLFVFAEALRITGVVTNAYVGLLTYLLLPAFFIFGLMLIPVGWWLYRRKTGKTTRELLSERFDDAMVAPTARGSRVMQVIGGLTLINLLFLGVGGARTLQFMDSARFCGTACHSVMNPEWTVYQSSPHARVPCVECHVGEGAEAAFDAKMNGLWQMISVTFDLYERPIPTPVHNLRPARETCEKCHWPEVFYGSRVKRIVRYEEDAVSTPRYTTLALKIGSGKGKSRGEIHWHIAAKNEVRYLATDTKRMKMRWAEVKQPDGSFKRYVNRALTQSALPKKGEAHKGEPHKGEPVRSMDCVDCHNRATHVYEDPKDAVDERMTAGEIDRTIPFAKRQALSALTGSYPLGVDGLKAIERDFAGFYQKQMPMAYIKHGPAIDRAVESLQRAYKRNIHARMNIDWNVYPSHLGHRGNAGCMRCHHADMVDTAGKAVKHECTLCHSMLSYQSKTPFKVLAAPDPTDPECKLHLHLRREFTGESPAGDPCKPSKVQPVVSASGRGSSARQQTAKPPSQPAMGGRVGTKTEPPQKKSAPTAKTAGTPAVTR